jgi:hypothetical protein
MLRKAILTAVLVTSASLYVLAQGVPATFILTDGEKKTGSVGFYGDKHENLIGGYLGLDTSAGRERFKVEQVAVVDFAGGGQPTATEINALPSDSSSNVLVLKNGYSQRGKLLNLVSGNVQWQNESGQTQQYAINDVNRIYLNPAAARMALNASSSSGAAVGTTGSAVPATPGTVQVQGNQAWTDSGITVKKGDRVSFNATGQISFGQSAGQTASPDGSADVKNPAYPVPVAGAGALIGKVGNSVAFPIGRNTSPIVMPADGRLMLGINDNELNDNSGSFTVVVKKQ